MKLTIFLFLLLVLCVSTFAQTKSDGVLKSLVNKMLDAQINFQPDTLNKILTADYIEISPAGEFDPREKVLGFYKPELKLSTDKTMVKVEAAEFSIREYKDFAIVITRLNYTIKHEEDPPAMLYIRATIICRKEDSDWKIASAQYTRIAPPRIVPQRK